MEMSTRKFEITCDSIRITKQIKITDHLENADTKDIGCIFNRDLNDLEEKKNIVGKECLKYLIDG